MSTGHNELRIGVVLAVLEQVVEPAVAQARVVRELALPNWLVTTEESLEYLGIVLPHVLQKSQLPLVLGSLSEGLVDWANIEAGVLLLQIYLAPYEAIINRLLLPSVGFCDQLSEDVELPTNLYRVSLYAIAVVYFEDLRFHAEPVDGDSFKEEHWKGDCSIVPRNDVQEACFGGVVVFKGVVVVYHDRRHIE